MIVAKTRAPVVPVRVLGSFEAFPRNSSFPRRMPITVIIGEAVRLDDLMMCGRDDYRKGSDRIMDAVAGLQSK
jgi:1-acyl-sn-glycerol-3-phosphate acyltransferase